MLIAAPRAGTQQGRGAFRGRRGEHLMPTLRQRAKRGFRSRRDDQWRQRAVSRRCRLRTQRWRGQHSVPVGAAEAERVDPGAACGPDRLDGADEPQVKRVEGDVWVRRLAMQRWRHAAALERQRRLDQPSHPRGRLQMPDIGLDRADRQRLAARLAERAPNGGGLDRVAGRRTGAVHLEKRQIVGGDAGACIDRADEGALRRLARQRQPDGAAVGIDAGAEDHRANAIAVRHRLAQRLEDYGAAAFAAHVTVGALVEGKAAAEARQHRGAAEAEKWIGRQQEVDAADDRAGDAFAPNRLARVVQGHQRGRAGGVDGQAWAAQVEDIGDAVGENAERAAGHKIGIAARRVAEAQIAVVGGGCADVHPGGAARELARRGAGILGSVPNQLEQHSLLRVHLRRFARRDPEKGRLEQIDIVEQACRPGIALRRLAASGVIVEAGRPAARIDLRDRIGPRGEQLPVRFQAGCSRKAAGGANDRDRPVTHSAEANSIPWRGKSVTAGRAASPSLHTPNRKDQL